MSVFYTLDLVICLIYVSSGFLSYVLSEDSNNKKVGKTNNGP